MLERFRMADRSFLRYAKRGSEMFYHISSTSAFSDLKVSPSEGVKRGEINWIAS